METDLEYLLTHSYKEQMIAGITANPAFFDEAIRLALSNKQPYAWRASWLLWSCMKPNDKRVRKYIPDIIRFLPECRDNQQRELLKILYLMEIDEDLEGRLFDICVSIWEKPGKPPSTRYNAFRMIMKIAGKYPELRHEIEFLSQIQYTETLSPGVRRGILKMLKEKA